MVDFEQALTVKLLILGVINVCLMKLKIHVVNLLYSLHKVCEEENNFESSCTYFTWQSNV